MGRLKRLAIRWFSPDSEPCLADEDRPMAGERGKALDERLRKAQMRDDEDRPLSGSHLGAGAYGG